MGQLTLSRRFATAARWPVGTCLTSWRYLWRTTPLSRFDHAGELRSHRAPELPSTFDQAGLQRPRDGAGPMYHRLYRINIKSSVRPAAELLEMMRQDPDVFAPSEFASFQKVELDGNPCQTGEEYVVRMPGPWDGPVRVVEGTGSCIRLATLSGHLEAGQIAFSATDEGHGTVVFSIESWARSSTRLTDLLYDRMRMSKEIQLHMWVSFLERVLKHSGGRRSGSIEIHTARVDDPDDS